jgi:ABC-type sugar transport system ATPase subunit
MISVRLEQVEVTYPRASETALQVPQLDLAAGDILAVVGVSGSGKSTLLRTVAGFIRRRETHRSLFNSLIVPRDYAPLTGSVFFNDQDVTDLSPRSRRVAFTTQALNLYPNMTAYENIAFPLRMADTNRDELTRRVHSIADKLHIERLLNRRPNELSGGEQQRVALGKALVQDANVYLFDEPLSSIDAPLRASFRKELRTWLRQPRRTTFYVTHDLDEASRRDVTSRASSRALQIANMFNRREIGLGWTDDRLVGRSW